MGEKQFETIPLPDRLKRSRPLREEADVTTETRPNQAGEKREKETPTPSPAFQRDEVGATLVRHSYGGLAGLRSPLALNSEVWKKGQG